MSVGDLSIAILVEIFYKFCLCEVVAKEKKLFMCVFYKNTNNCLIMLNVIRTDKLYKNKCAIKVSNLSH